MVLVALFLVNLPFAHEALSNRRIDRSGQEVEATLLASRSIDGSHLVEYRLPSDVDPERRRFSAQVDAAADNRPVGEVPNHLFAFVAVAGDVILLLVGFAWWWRRGRGAVHE